MALRTCKNDPGLKSFCSSYRSAILMLHAVYTIIVKNSLSSLCFALGKPLYGVFLYLAVLASSSKFQSFFKFKNKAAKQKILTKQQYHGISKRRLRL